MGLASLVLLCAGPSAVAMPVVHAASDDGALARAREQVGAVELEPVSVETLLAQPPTLLSGGRVKTCPGDGARLDESLEAVRSAYLYGESGLRARVDAIGAALPCARATPSQLGRYGLMAGVVHLEAGNEAQVDALFAAAHDWDPEVAWDDAFGPKHAERFRSATVPDAQATLTVHPSAEVLVDGHPHERPLPLRPGLHHVWVGGTGAMVELADADDILVVPPAFPRHALTWMADPARRRDVSALLSATLGEGVEAAVHVDGRTWTGTTGRVDWTPHGGPEQATPSTPPPPVVDPERGRGPLLAIGLGTAGVGVVAAATSLALSGNLVDQPTRGPRDVGAGVYYGGLGLTAVGATLATAGVLSGTF